jgi:16S rRNA C967 or C1407 C5-methylase (RsmB/RsmF family)
MNFDFASLLRQYSDKNVIDKFKVVLTKKAVSSFLINPNVITAETIEKDLTPLTKDPQDPLLFRYDREALPLGKSLLHAGGAFYILDPSSAAISYYLKDLVAKDPLVLDMAAAPGGKSIAFSFRRPDSLIVANDLSYSRALEIAKNTDRLGLTNILSLSLDLQALRVASCFDLVILDAPCSGSGMIRKDEAMAADWSPEKVSRLLPVQEALLEKGYSLLKKGGILAYSTCSLSVEEDEDQITAFLKRHPQAEEIKIKVPDTIITGKAGYHLIPGVYDGEGIYFAFIRKNEGSPYVAHEIKYEASPVPGLHAFRYRKNLFFLSRMVGELSNLPYLVPGIKQLDDSDHPKCLYDHAYSKVSPEIPLLELSKEEALLYESGQELSVSSSLADGLVILTYQSLRLGFGKKLGKKVKNYLPKGLRQNLVM